MWEAEWDSFFCSFMTILKDSSNEDLVCHDYYFMPCKPTSSLWDWCPMGDTACFMRQYVFIDVCAIVC